MAKPNDPSNLDRLAEQIKAGLASEVDSATAIDATEAILSDTAGAVGLESTPPAETPIPAASPSTDLGVFVSNLTQEQLSRVRQLAQSRGIDAGPKRDPHGNLLIEIRIDSDLIPALESWSEQSGKSLKEQVQEIADYLFPGYLIGGGGIPEIVATPAVSTAGATRS